MMNYRYQNKNIYYSLEASGPCVVLLHGFLHDSEMWINYKTKWLQNGYSILCLDLPGHGNSEAIKDISIETIAEILNEIILENEIPKLTIIGHSLGGYTGLAYAKLFPQKVDKLILLHSSAYADTSEVKQKRDLWLKIIAKHPAMFFKSVISFLYTKESALKFESVINNDIDKAKLKGKEAYIDIIKAMRDRPDTLSVLSSETNVYFLAGKLDKVIPEEISLAQIEMLTTGRGLVLENTSHMSFVEDSDNAFEALDSFLKD